ncbi:MAG: right-handed parallel beta-helix repeat-containing protein [Planctomycetota bacterium]
MDVQHRGQGLFELRDHRLELLGCEALAGDTLERLELIEIGKLGELGLVKAPEVPAGIEGHGFLASSRRDQENDRSAISDNHTMASHYFGLHDGAGIYLGPGCSANVTGNILQNNQSVNEGKGAGLFAWDCTTVITGNIFKNNKTDLGEGTAIACSGGSHLIAGNTISWNDIGHSAVFITGEASATVSSNIIVQNKSQGIYCYQASPTIVNNMILRNVDSAIACREASPTITNNTMMGNHALLGGAIQCRDGSHATVTNSILWGNVAEEGAAIWIGTNDDPSAVTIRYSDVMGGQASVHTEDGSLLYWQEGMIDEDPRFENPGLDALRITQLSPCLNRGDGAPPGGLPERDFEGDPRAALGYPDIGADEAYQVVASSFQALEARDRAVWYVDAGNEPGPGSGSRADPYRTIIHALQAASDGHTVLVRPGTYRGAIDFQGKAVVLRSDHDGDPYTVDLATETTVIDGEQSWATVQFWRGEGLGAVIQGFTIFNGGSSGVYCTQDASPTVIDNTITGNGCGIELQSSSAFVARNRIMENQGLTTGAGINCFSGAPTITHNLIARNRTGLEAMPTGVGGGIYLSSPQATVANNLFLENRSGVGGGMSIMASYKPPIVRNNTFVNNQASGSGGSLYCWYSKVEVGDCIFWGNGAPVGAELAVRGDWMFPSSLTITYSDVEGGEAGVFVDPDCTLDWGPGMIDIDPAFTDPPRDDYSLKAVSPCVDAGDPAHAPCLDVDRLGGSRLLDGRLDREMRVDMGAHELGNIHLEVSGSATPGGWLTFTTSGTPGLTVFLYVGTQEGASCWPPYGVLRFDIGAPWTASYWGDIPAPGTYDVVVLLPSDLPTPLRLVLQEVGLELGTPAGNTSRAIALTIR